MRTLTLVSLLGLSLFLGAGCDTSMEPAAKPVVDATLNQPFTLEPGQTAVLAEQQLSVTFERVLEDGRCPVDLICIAAGHATMAVRAEQDGKTAMTLSLTLPALADGVVYEGFHIHPEVLLPAPLSTRTIPPGDYRLTMRVDRP